MIVDVPITSTGLVFVTGGGVGVGVYGGSVMICPLSVMALPGKSV